MALNDMIIITINFLTLDVNTAHIHLYFTLIHSFIHSTAKNQFSSVQPPPRGSTNVSSLQPLYLVTLDHHRHRHRQISKIKNNQPALGDATLQHFNISRYILKNHQFFSFLFKYYI